MTFKSTLYLFFGVLGTVSVFVAVPRIPLILLLPMGGCSILSILAAIDYKNLNKCNKLVEEIEKNLKI